eukprot:scaffold2626_cov141-Amphora_coffeaeformis.AAC.1
MKAMLRSRTRALQVWTRKLKQEPLIFPSWTGKKHRTFECRCQIRKKRYIGLDSSSRYVRINKSRDHTATTSEPIASPQSEYHCFQSRSPSAYSYSPCTSVSKDLPPAIGLSLFAFYLRFDANMEDQRRCLPATTPTSTSSVDSASLLELLHAGRVYEISRNGPSPRNFPLPALQGPRISIAALIGIAIETARETEGEQELRTITQ